MTHATPRILAIALLCLIWACRPPADPGQAQDLEPSVLNPDPRPVANPEPSNVPPGPDEIKIATFNVELLFDTRCDSGRCGGNDFEKVYSPSQLDARAGVLASAIDRLDADIVLLQEIETEESLKALQAATGDRFSVAEIGEIGYDASIDVAVLAKGDLQKVVTHRHRPLLRSNGEQTRFSREFLEVHLSMGQREIIVFSTHFKSKRNDDPERRKLEALRAHSIVTKVAEAHPGALIVMGGDLNDVPGSPPLNALEDGGRMLRVASDVTKDTAWTYNYRGNLQELDHLYLAVGRGRYVAGSAQAVRDGSTRGLGGSDHAGLVATFGFTR